MTKQKQFLEEIKKMEKDKEEIINQQKNRNKQLKEQTNRYISMLNLLELKMNSLL